MTEKKEILHLLSGGLDSVVLLYDLSALGYKVKCLLFDYGQKHVQELTWAKHHCGRLGSQFTVMEIPRLAGSALTDGEKETWVVPNRNAIFLSIACNRAEALGIDTVTFAANADDAEGFPDCRKRFVDAFNQTLFQAELKVRVVAPYLERKKWWIAGLGREMGVPFYETWSCYEGGAEPCGKCDACKKREAALCS